MRCADNSADKQHGKPLPGSYGQIRTIWVFTTEFGRYVNNKTLYLKRVMRSQGLSELRFHDLRHTFAVNSLKAGDDIKTVQENLGHATASFTLSTYAHATPGMKRESANRMGQYLRRIRESTEAAKSSV